MNLSDQPFQHQWRSLVAHLVTKLDGTRAIVDGLTSPPGTKPSRRLRRQCGLAREQLRGLVEELEAFRSDYPHVEDLDKATATGSMLAIRGLLAATVALDVMIEVMDTLPSLHQGYEAEELLAAFIDAKQSFDDSRAISVAASRAYGSALWDLEEAYTTDGEIALRRRVAAERSNIHSISAGRPTSGL